MTDNEAFEVSVSQNFKYSCQVYKVMEREAQYVKADDGKPGTTIHVWEGFFTKLITEQIGLSVPYYSTIRRELLRMGCIRQLRRGGGSSPSQWELLQPPTEELWHSAPAKKHQAGSKQAANEGQINDLVRRVNRMEENFEVLMEALASGNFKVAFDEPKPERNYEVINGGN